MGSASTNHQGPSFHSKPSSSVPSDSVSESFRNDVKKINANIRMRETPYTDSEDEGEILYKDDTNEEDQQNALALKIARRDTIARENEINEIQNNAKSDECLEHKNDVSLSHCFIILFTFCNLR